MTSIPKFFSGIISDIYEASYNPEIWQTVIKRIVNISKSKSGAIFIQDNYLKQGGGFYSFGLSEEVLKAYKKYSHFDPAFHIMKNEEVAVALNIHGPKQHELETSEYYENVRKKYDIGYVGGATVFTNNEQHVGLGLHRSSRDSEFDSDTLALITELIPHLARAIKIRREFMRLRIGESVVERTQNELLIGLVLFDKSATPVYFNSVAKSIINEHPALKQQDMGFNPINRSERIKLYQLINISIENSLKEKFDSIELIGLSHSNRSFPLILMIKPHDFELHGEPLGVPLAYAEVFITDPESALQLNSQFLDVLYNLSPAESKIAIALSKGMSVKEISVSFHKSIDTVRSQLKSLFRKTQTKSQSELVQVLLRSSILQSADKR
ncbi:helix-turn-helix transcriptional regulator [Haliea sp. AH-315-K21]|uniref:HTH luxR-type domain-containing protein n=1 Tax=SAR86 cluster bacterium TaxID=2030880 RepID=A0A2A5CBX8_9GAMM|nr:helix-turn-helix transcriptional regulator [Haliea sp. AH-315-K21]PCJ40940.1 MAG: hypothetical protein COA71_10090 [SAR86 cluster bacterium]